jgi:hypothetical protein
VKHRVPALVAALALFAMLIPLTTAVVLAWAPPSIASVCSNDPTVNNWTVTLAHESNYNMQWADNSGFSGATNVTMAEGANALSTPSSVTTLYVRWASDHSSTDSATWSGGSCSSPAPSQTPYESFQGETATPIVTAPPTQAPTDTPIVTAPPTQAPTDTPIVTDPPTEAPTDTPIVTAPPTAAPTATLIVTDPPTEEPTSSPTATNCIGIIGAQAAAFVSEPPCQTPFESFQGETATPPPTGTAASDSQSSNSTPLIALLICFIIGGAGLAAAQLQRRTIRR